MSKPVVKVALIGPQGCGKTWLSQWLCGIEPKRRDTIVVDMDVARLPFNTLHIMDTAGDLSFISIAESTLKKQPLHLVCLVFQDASNVGPYIRIAKSFGVPLVAVSLNRDAKIVAQQLDTTHFMTVNKHNCRDRFDVFINDLKIASPAWGATLRVPSMLHPRKRTCLDMCSIT